MLTAKQYCRQNNKIILIASWILQNPNKYTWLIPGGEEGENSLTSFEGILFNGVPNSLDVDDTTSKDSNPKSLMLADLLEKNIKTEKEPPVLNGALRIGEKEGGTLKMELIQESEKSLKRPPTTENDCNTQAKRPHINGDATPEEPLDEGVSRQLSFC